MQSPVTLPEAQKIILGHTAVTNSEELQLSAAHGRVPVKALHALHYQPGYDQSAYDGYVIGEDPPPVVDGMFSYRLVDEIAAGDTSEKEITPGQTFRIMTGGVIPRMGWKVVAQEYCHEDRNLVRMPTALVLRGPANIQRKGSEYSPGHRIAAAGVLLTPDLIARLAEAGLRSITVRKRPLVAYFCTGSELVDSHQQQLNGQKISSNRYLLEGLIRSCGAKGDDRGIVIDRTAEMGDLLTMIEQAAAADIIISTGGMGPGKYDMLEEVFQSLGGSILFNSLQLRPGKSTLFGILGRGLFFGLPGPPQAVKAIFHELVRPAILQAQGLGQSARQRVRAHLEEDIIVRKRGVLKLQEGFFSLAKGRCMVRPLWRQKNGNCYILCPGHRKKFHRGELVTVDLLPSSLLS